MDEKREIRSSSRTKSVGGITWQELEPDERGSWLVPKSAEEFEAFIPLGTKGAKLSGDANPQLLFRNYSIGVVTNRDSVVYDFRRDVAVSRLRSLSRTTTAKSSISPCGSQRRYQ